MATTTIQYAPVDPGGLFEALSEPDVGVQARAGEVDEAGQRSYVEQRIGQLVGIFQIERKQLADQVEASAIPSEDGMVGLVAVADGGRLSETAFNVWTVASQLFKEAGAPESNRIDFNLSDLARRLWGPNGKSGSLRQRIADATTELMKTRVVVVGIDPYTREPSEGATWELSLLEAAGARGEFQKIFDAAKQNDREAVARLASLARGTGEKATWSMVLPMWLAESIRGGQGVILDYEVQRALRGSAKRIWIQLESYPGWRPHRLEPLAEEELVSELRSVTEGRIVVEPAEDDPAIRVQTAVLDLSAELYAAFGITHANRKRDVENACKSILATDKTYLMAEVRPVRGNKRRYELVVARAMGDLRQDRHRDALRDRVQLKAEMASQGA